MGLIIYFWLTGTVFILVNDCSKVKSKIAEEEVITEGYPFSLFNMNHLPRSVVISRLQLFQKLPSDASIVTVLD